MTKIIILYPDVSIFTLTVVVKVADKFNPSPPFITSVYNQ